MDGGIAVISGAVFGGVLLACAVAAGPPADLNPFNSTDAPAATTAADAIQGAPGKQDTGISAGDLVAVSSSDPSYDEEPAANLQDAHDGEHGQTKHDHDVHERDDD